MTFSCINALLSARTRAMIAGALIGLSLASAVNAQSQSPLFDRAPVPEASTAPAPSSGPLDAIRSLWSGKKATVELLPPEQAFTLDVRFRDASTLVAELRPVQGYYLYRDRITFSMTEPATENKRLTRSSARSRCITNPLKRSSHCASLLLLVSRFSCARHTRDATSPWACVIRRSTRT